MSLPVHDERQAQVPEESERGVMEEALSSLSEENSTVILKADCLTYHLNWKSLQELDWYCPLMEQKVKP